MEWEPIETAERVHGRPILCAGVLNGFATAWVCYWDKHLYRFVTQHRSDPPVTHWMPLPPPPQP